MRKSVLIIFLFLTLGAFHSEAQTTLREARMPAAKLINLDSATQAQIIQYHIHFNLGWSISNTMYSDNRRNHAAMHGISLSAESHFALTEKSEFGFGIAYQQNGFRHTNYQVDFLQHTIALPIYIRYPLPVFDELISIYTGFTQYYVLNTSKNGDYPSDEVIQQNQLDQPIIGRIDERAYSPSDFRSFYLGWSFGLQADWGLYRLDFRITPGITTVMNNLQDLPSSYVLSVGVYPFRGKGLIKNVKSLLNKSENVDTDY
ncbi:MAG: hypothetical protein LAT68_12880 [Cyclobacteriaceae bacterium]|nr:hypothetical protein [Cyclobacteriaceae bacterium]MCH8517214.1 hypothetical protein [Cyclobacteriaceae bacterium]